MKEKVLIMDAHDIERTIIRMAHEIIEKNSGAADLSVIGIQRRGVTLAKRIVEILECQENVKIDTGILDITLYRDDLSLLDEHPVIKNTDVPFVIGGKKLILVDDVLFTGRTVHAAINALTDMGRAKSIQLAVLIDRGHRELPVYADFAGKRVPTSIKEFVGVKVNEFDGMDEVAIYDK